MADISAGISALVNELNTLRNNSGDPKLQAKLQTILTQILFPLWQEIIQQKIANTTPEYLAAAASLDAATKSAQAAEADIAKVAQAIADAVKAAKAVDQVVGVVLPLLGLL